MSRFGDLITGKTTPEPVVAEEPVVAAKPGAEEAPKKKPKKVESKSEEKQSWLGGVAPKKLQL